MAPEKRAFHAHAYQMYTEIWQKEAGRRMTTGGFGLDRIPPEQTERIQQDAAAQVSAELSARGLEVFGRALTPEWVRHFYDLTGPGHTLGSAGECRPDPAGSAPSSTAANDIATAHAGLAIIGEADAEEQVRL